MVPYLNQKDSNGNVLRVGYTVDDHDQEKDPLHPSLPLLQHADLEDKVVLLRVDHNVVKKGQRWNVLALALCHQEAYPLASCTTASMLFIILIC